jgi:hypothetical protein
MTRTMQRRVRARRLDGLCAAGRPAVRRVPPPGYDVTIRRGPLEQLVDIVVEAEWMNDEAWWLCHGAWLRRRGSWRQVQLGPNEWRQVQYDLQMVND